jgi:hypothetical protein
MSRLKHSSPEAYHRGMQISTAQVFVFVEGKAPDPYFYENICGAVYQPNRIGYEIRLAKELGGDGGGKKVLLGFFDFLEQRGALTNKLNGKTTQAIFFLDKDADDVLGIQRISDHIIYTKYYDVENHIFVEGDIIKGAAVAASLDIRMVTSAIGDPAQWRFAVASQWKVWIAFCIFTLTRQLNFQCNYSRLSIINDPQDGPVDTSKSATYLGLLETESGLAHQEFIDAFQSIMKLVADLFSRSEHDRVFKGKWYSFFLTEKVKSIAGYQLIKLNGLQDRILTAITMGLDFSDAWAEHFKTPLRKLINEF